MTYMTVALDRSVLPAPYILGDRVADRCLKETVPLRRSFRSPCPLHSQGQGRRSLPQRDSPPAPVVDLLQDTSRVRLPSGLGHVAFAAVTLPVRTVTPRGANGLHRPELSLGR